MSAEILHGDCLTVLPTLAAGSVQTCVTSPPYWGLRDYGTAKWEGGDAACDHKNPKYANPNATTRGGLAAAAERSDGKPRNAENRADKDGGVMFSAYRDICGKCGATRIDAQLGLEKTPDEYVAKMVQVFREVRRVLRDDGTLWLNLGDSYATTASGNQQRYFNGQGADYGRGTTPSARRNGGPRSSIVGDLKPKDLVGIPWRVAFALQADGWYLRSDIIWHKPNPMPESVTDRPTKAHEYLFLLTKSERYYYDAEAIREPNSATSVMGGRFVGAKKSESTGNGHSGLKVNDNTWNGRNRRSVWTVATRPYKGAHFATFPPALIEPCILAGSAARSCEHCGAAWVRRTERGETTGRGTSPGQPAHLTPQGYLRDGKSRCGDAVRATTGWQPSCDCEHNTGTARSVVLDPFGGSGTTAAVAEQHGRNAISIELNAAYLPLQHERLAKVQPALGVA